jgi:hypothetical protein
MDNGWATVTPKVNLEAEFWEIANDFGNPFELLREAISNAIDAKATWISARGFAPLHNWPRPLQKRLATRPCGH